MRPRKPKYRAMRSNFETIVLEELSRLGVKYEYETHTLEYYKPVRNGVCLGCGGQTVGRKHIYNPDFWLPDHGIYIEAKGLFASTDRMKMRLVVEQHPREDIRMVFMRNNKISKASSTHYIEYAEKYGMKAGLLSDMEGWLCKT